MSRFSKNIKENIKNALKNNELRPSNTASSMGRDQNYTFQTLINWKFKFSDRQ